MEIAGTSLQQVGTFFFVLAVLHTFAVKLFHRFANAFAEGTLSRGFFLLLGEVEIVFGFWAGLLVVVIALFTDVSIAAQSLRDLSFREPVFVLAIMVIASTRPILQSASLLVAHIARWIPIKTVFVELFLVLSLVPLLGSFITEPAAMTMAALLLRDRYFIPGVEERLKYAILGVLFVNVSIGGALTSYAAPPILMVAQTWGWTTSFVFGEFGVRAILAVVISAGFLVAFFRRQLLAISLQRQTFEEELRVPAQVVIINFGFLVGLIVFHTHLELFVGWFLFFLGYASISSAHQGPLKLKEGLLVSFFLGGLVVLGQYQSWWVEAVLANLERHHLFFGSAALTAVLDNAALTYLGSLVPNTTSSFQYFLVAGSICGGGLTVIANAPNPTGYSALRSKFEEGSIAPGGLLLAALPPTVVALACLGWGRLF